MDQYNRILFVCEGGTSRAPMAVGIFNDFTFNMVTVYLAAVFQLVCLSDIDSYRCIELKCAAAGGGFGISVKNAHLFTELVNEDNNAVAFCDDGRELSHCLRHKSCLYADI